MARRFGASSATVLLMVVLLLLQHLSARVRAMEDAATDSPATDSTATVGKHGLHFEQLITVQRFNEILVDTILVAAVGHPQQPGWHSVTRKLQQQAMEQGSLFTDPMIKFATVSAVDAPQIWAQHSRDKDAGSIFIAVFLPGYPKLSLFPGGFSSLKMDGLGDMISELHHLTHIRLKVIDDKVRRFSLAVMNGENFEPIVAEMEAAVEASGDPHAAATYGRVYRNLVANIKNKGVGYLAKERNALSRILRNRQCERDIKCIQAWANLHVLNIFLTDLLPRAETVVSKEQDDRSSEHHSKLGIPSIEVIGRMNSEECFVFSERLIDLEVEVLRQAKAFGEEVLQIMHEDGGIPKADIMERLHSVDVAMRQGKPASKIRGRMYIKYGEIMERAIYVKWLRRHVDRLWEGVVRKEEALRLAEDPAYVPVSAPLDM
eukprot:g3409.t1